jgi:Subtilase family
VIVGECLTRGEPQLFAVGECGEITFLPTRQPPKTDRKTSIGRDKFMSMPLSRRRYWSSLLMSLGFVALGAVTASVVVAQSDSRVSQAAPPTISVRLEGGLAAAHYGEVLAALGQDQLLLLEPYVDVKGQTPTEIMAASKRLAGSSIALTLSRYLCTINPQACSLRGSTGPIWRNVRAPQNARPETSPCPDSKLPPYVLCLPNVTVEPYTTSAEVSYDAKRENLSTVVTERSNGCVRLDDQCRKFIKNLNPYIDPFSPTFSGQVMVPVQGYAVTLPVRSPDQLARITASLNKLIQQLTRQGQLSNRETRLYYTVPFEAKRREAAFLAPPPPANEPLTNYLQPLRVMNYPYATPDDFIKAKLPPVRVAVWDNYVDITHCDYQTAASESPTFVAADLIPYDPKHDPNFPDRVKPCGTSRSTGFFSDRWDHGTFVAGIIGARLNGVGMAGVNPKAGLWAYELTGERLRANDPIADFILRHGEGPRVVNISMSDDVKDQRYQTDLDAIIRKYRGSVLFVAAAGNGNSQVGSNDTCLVIPACLSNRDAVGDALISVVALSADGQSRLTDSPGSNYGQAFDVAAVGVAFSTLYGDSFGTLPGTSIATPYVTGLASLIYAQAFATGPKPRDVKERILYTVDMSDELDDVVRFGRINFGRALDLAQDTIELKKAFASTALVRARPIRKRPTDVLTVVTGTEGAHEVTNLRIRVGQVRRISAPADDSAVYRVIYVDANGGLKKLQDVTFEANAVLTYGDANSPKSVQVSSIREYVCALECK